MSLIARSFALLLSLAPLTLGVLAAGCSAETSEEDVDTASSDLTGKLTPAQLAATKAQLRAIANANMTRTDNFAAVRTQVDPLVEKLARHFGQRSATQKIPLVAGAWRQLWSDYPYPMTPFISMDPTQVYQVVSASGHYWNVGDQKALGFLGLTGVLRGKFEPSGTKIALEFTAVGFRFGRVSRGTDLVGFADDLESGDAYYLPTPGGGKAPRGPVGIKGTLETLYVDADLRVDRGTQEDFVDGQGAVLVPGYGPKIFVLDRVVAPAK
ncbi:MAG: hypothetical protein JST00_47440 [Deltaproteobacteria bacterium]|nr:hypothetical protein [Deltaproteobacteria bacterium]